MTQRILLIFSLCLAQQFYAQNDFRKGFIINNLGETIHGLINYREGAKSNEMCEFKRSEDQEATSYSPTQLAGYGFENDAYFSSKNINATGESAQRMFLEVLVQGTATLYNYRGRFYIEKGTEFKELVNDFTEEQIGTEVFKKYTNRHIGTLTLLLNDCDDVKNRIQKIKLVERSLTLLVEKYNACKGGTSISYKDNKPWVDANFGVLTGVNFSSFSYNESVTEAGFFTNDLGGNTTLMFGAFADIFAPRINERIAFHIGVNYLSTKYTMHEFEESFIYNYERNVKAKFNKLSVPIGMRFFFSKNTFTPYFNIGLSNTFALKSSVRYTEEQQSTDFVITKEDEIKSRNYKLGYWAGLGLKKRISNNISAFIEARYDYAYGSPSNIEFAGAYVFGSGPRDGIQVYHQDNTSSFQVLIGIQL